MEENAISHCSGAEVENPEFGVILGITVISSESRAWAGAFIGILEGKASQSRIDWNISGRFVCRSSVWSLSLADLGREKYYTECER